MAFPFCGWEQKCQRWPLHSIYRIVGNFRGRELSRISCLSIKVFSAKINSHTHTWLVVPSNPWTFSSQISCSPPIIRESFLPQKFPTIWYTLNQLLASLLRHMCTANPNTPNFVDKNTHFQGLHGTLDNVFRKLHENGIGRKVKHAEIVTKDEENQLWESGKLGTKTPRSLQNTVKFLFARRWRV